MNKFSDKKIVDSWSKNATPWIQAIQKNEIESRRIVTDQAIIDTVLSCSAKTVLDIGCGEGWLVRALSACGIICSGLDIVPELIEEAIKQSAHEFSVLAYEEISTETIPNKYDAVVCNFSLLGEKSVEKVFSSARTLLNQDGVLIVQTLHPETNSTEGEYKDGWREGSWAGFSDQFYDPAPWYFRTTESWVKLFQKYGYKLVSQKQTINPKTEKPASLILLGRAG
ncbi:MAG: class I SAM-dependent methyltransferase [Pseudomonadales bacterium]|nr:class I SAM-dependent methyltransferase [Pseudomonadales bacterium]